MCSLCHLPRSISPILTVDRIFRTLFYNEPSPPEGIFDQFVVMSFVSLVGSYHANDTGGSGESLNMST